MQVNGPGQAPVLLVIFEGWCVGFRALDDLKLRERWQLAAREADAESRLWRYELEELAWVNEELREYDALTEYVAFVLSYNSLSLARLSWLNIQGFTLTPRNIYIHKKAFLIYSSICKLDPQPALNGPAIFLKRLLYHKHTSKQHVALLSPPFLSFASRQALLSGIPYFCPSHLTQASAKTTISSMTRSNPGH